MLSSDPVERLPPEIVDEILGLIWGASLSCKDLPSSLKLNSIGPLAAVSRKWKPLLERITFREFVLTPKRVLEALERKYYASEGLVNTRAVLLDLPHAFCTDGDLDEDTDKLDRRVVEEHFNKSIHQIFEFLKQLPSLERPHLKLTTGSEECCGSPCKAYDVEFINLDANWENLPELPMVLSFNCFYYHMASLSPQTYCRLASKMTRLDKIDWIMRDRLSRHRPAQVKDRSSESFAINHPHLALSNSAPDLGRSLDLLPKSLTKFELNIFSPPYNRSYHARERMHTGLPDDIFSQGVRRLIQRDGIIEVSLQASVDSNMFCPTQGSQEDLIHCPTLEKLEINFLSDYHYKKLMVHGDDLVDPIRTYCQDTEGPDLSNSKEGNSRGTKQAGKHERRHKAMDRLILAAARSVSHMPKIVYFSCRLPGKGFEGLTFNKEPNDPYEGLIVYEDPEKFRLSKAAWNAWKTTSETHGIEFNPLIIDNIEID
ncbi:hypothetical protein HG530_005778 [Fusarium avenaceum]|nr:hypothetical protein HG530_005778 [Fusarium avenaceum]